MAWFDKVFEFDKSSLRLAHITDCHLFAEQKECYFGVNTAVNFSRCLADIAKKNVDAIIFGGDLTQDHSFNSYLVFAELIAKANLNCPVFWLPGNHDEIDYLNKISRGQIKCAKRLRSQGAELLLVNSKSSTPAGWVNQKHLDEIANTLTSYKQPTLVFCHHNPLPISGYLDKHMLENGPQLLNVLVNAGQVKALFHGHVHHQYQFDYRGLAVYATPASSIQFTKNTTQWQQSDLGPSYRLINLFAPLNSTQLDITTDVIWLDE
ncbi:MAG: metallophosphoesterase [Pseudoalteromonas sp.]|uniref:metallophosphoesterase n=1 Tax=unclassified Pseudoalteromonas TaxID=194690 RepID=UPI003F9B4F86